MARIVTRGSIDYVVSCRQERNRAKPRFVCVPSLEDDEHLVGADSKSWRNFDGLNRAFDTGPQS